MTAHLDHHMPFARVVFKTLTPESVQKNADFIDAPPHPPNRRSERWPDRRHSFIGRLPSGQDLPLAYFAGCPSGRAFGIYQEVPDDVSKGPNVETVGPSVIEFRSESSLEAKVNTRHSDLQFDLHFDHGR